jgi:hypothetical protein
LIPPELRPRLEAARLDTLALLRAIDQAFLSPRDLPHTELHVLYELDADCAEALWALDQPAGSLDFKAMVRDTLASLSQLPPARDAVRTRLPSASQPRVRALELTIRANLNPREAYNDIPRSPHAR